MTEAEAISAVQNDLKWHSKELKPKYKEALNMAIKALEKQIAKKPVENEIYGVSSSIFCPSCESELCAGQQFCDKCGQHLKWKRCD